MAELSLLLKATTVLTLALAAVHLLRRSRASIRALLLVSAFAVLLVLPVAAALIPPRTIVIPLASPDSFLVFGDVATPAWSSAVAPATTDVQPQPVRFAFPPLAATLRIIWAAGAILCGGIVLTALLRLRRMRHHAIPWLEGGALLESAARQAGVTRRVILFLHPDLPAPMTCGLLRPAIGLPIDATCWPEPDVRDALVHEMEHVRRGDWITHLLARFVCALYWFHPMVWPALRQLSLESDRACDDAVLHGSEGTAYAEQLLLLARRIKRQSAVPMLSMAGRSNLALRVAAVLDSRVARGRAGAIATVTVAILTMALALMISPLQAVGGFPAPARAPQSPQADGQAPAFEVTSIKRNTSSDPARGRVEPGRFTAVNTPLLQIVRQAYDLLPSQVLNAPDWMQSERYDILAKAPEGVALTVQSLTPFLRDLMTQRFAFTAHFETRELPIYELVVARRDRTPGPRLEQADIDCTVPVAGPTPGRPPSEKPVCSLVGLGGRYYQVRGYPLSRFAQVLGSPAGRVVVDKTGLAGAWNLELDFTPDTLNAALGDPSAISALQEQFGVKLDPNAPSLFTALQEQLGLKLEPARGPVNVLVIDRVERPTEN